MGFTDEQKKRILAAAGRLDAVEAGITSRVVNNANEAAAAKVNRQSAQIASRLDNPINSPSVQAKRSAQIARNLDNSLINKATTGTTNPAEMYRPGNVTESLFKTPNYVSNNAMTEMVDRANARLALQQDNTAVEKTREATRKSTEQQKAAMERMVADLYQKMEGYKNNGQTDELFKAEQEYAKLNDSIAQMNSKIHGSAMEEAKDWETQRYNEIMSTGGRVLLANLERLAELSDNRIKEADDERRNGLTETETEYYDLYNNLKTKYGDQVDSWLEYAKRVGNKSQMAMSIAKARQAAEDKPFWASVGSVPLNMASGAGYLDVIGQNLQRSITGSDAPIDYNSPAQKASKMTGAIRGTVSEDMGKVGSFLYNTGMSMADSVVSMSMGNFGLALLGGSAATNAMQAAIERGASDDQALKIGILAGALEFALERTSIDRLFNLAGAKTVADFFTNAFKQSGVELTEEGLTKLGNTFADAVIMGNKSELNTAKRDYIADGYSPEKAEGMALKDWGVDLLLDMAGGALSGFLFGSFKSGFDVIQNGGFQKPTVDSVMPKPKQETQTQPPVADITPTPQQAQEAPTPASVMPKPQQTETVPVAEFRQTAAEILSEGIFDSPTYGEALEQTGMKRADVRDALRTVARNNIAAASDPKVQVVLNVIRNVDAQPVQAQVKVPAQTTPEQTVSEVVSRMVGEPKGTAENANFVNEAPKVQDDIHEIEPGAKPAMGAADYGFSGEIGGWKRDADTFVKDTEIPKYDKDGGTISDAAGSLFEANVPNETKEEIEQASYEGGFTFPKDTNQKQVQRVLDDIERLDFDTVFERTVGLLEEGKASGNTTAAAWVMFVQAANKGDHARAAEIYSLMVPYIHDAAQALQAQNIYKKLSPEGKLIGMQKAAARLNRQLADKGKGNPFADSPRSTQQESKSAVDDVRETTLSLLENLQATLQQEIENWQEAAHQNREHGVPVEDWMKEIGGIVSKALQGRIAPPSGNKSAPVAQTIKKDILEFTEHYVKKQSGGSSKKRTAADTLTDFFNNRESYIEAWQEAQKDLLEKYGGQNSKGKPKRIPPALLQFMGAYAPDPQDVVFRAISDIAVEQELNQKQLQMKAFLGDSKSVSEAIFGTLQAQTDAEGADADMLRAAVDKYIQQEANAGRAKRGNYTTLDADIRRELRRIGVTEAQLVRNDRATNDAIGQRIAAKIAAEYGISEAGSTKAAELIARRFQDNIIGNSEAVLREKNRTPSKDWATQIGDELGQTLDNKVSPKEKPRTTTVAQTVKRDLVTFAENYLGKQKGTGQKRTATDTLRDYFNNRGSYSKAWDEAKTYLTQKYGDNIPGSLEDFLAGAISYNGVGSDKVMLRAIADTAVADSMTNKQIQMRDYLGDGDRLAADIANELIEKTGATGADAVMIQDAARQYVAEKVQGASRDGSETLDSDIRSTMKSIGMDMAKFLRQDNITKDVVAKRMADLLISKYGISEENAWAVTDTILTRFNETVAQKSEKVLRRIVEPKSGKEKKTFRQTFRELANMGAFTDSQYSLQVTEKLFGHKVTIDPNYMTEFLNARTPEARDAAEAKIWENIGQQIPTTFAEAAEQIRYFSMLANPSTHIKNISGNASQMVLTMGKDSLATLLEMGTDNVIKAFGGNGIQRTKAFLNLASKNDQALLSTAWGDYANVQDEVAGIGKYKQGADGKIEENRQYLKLNNPETKVARAVDATLRGVGKAVDANSDAMNVEDRWFSQPNYAVALAGYMKANDLVTPTAEARNYAVKEAQKATFRDLNAVSKFAKNLGTGSGFGRFLTKTIFPFKGTPANVGVRAVEYSPAGLAVTLCKAAKAAYNGEFKAAEFIDDLSANLTGIALYALGFALAKNGALRATGIGDDKEKEQQKLEGKKNNSLFGVPIEFLSNGASSMLAGAATYEAVQTKIKNGEGYSVVDYLEAISGITNPVFETTMLTGFDDVISSVRGSSSGELGELLANMSIQLVGNYIGSYIPTLLSRTAAATDRYARKTYVDKSDMDGLEDLPSVQKAVQNILYKIPGGRHTMVKNIDAWGRPVEGNMETGGNLLENVLGSIFNVVTPTYPGENKETPVDVELKRLYNSEYVNRDEVSLFMTPAGSSVSVDGKDVYLTGDQWEQYQTDRGQGAMTMRENLLNSKAYQNLSDGVKAVAMDIALDYANNLAKEKLDVGFEIKTEWMKDLADADADTITNAIISRAIYREAGKIDEAENDEEKTRQDYFIDILNDLDINRSEKRKRWIDAGYAESTCPW